MLCILFQLAFSLCLDMCDGRNRYSIGGNLRFKFGRSATNEWECRWSLCCWGLRQRVFLLAWTRSGKRKKLRVGLGTKSNPRGQKSCNQKGRRLGPTPEMTFNKTLFHDCYSNPNEKELNWKEAEMAWVITWLLRRPLMGLADSSRDYANCKVSTMELKV